MTLRTPNIYLIGPMGSGKSTIGKRTASLLELDFVDCDTELESRTGASINLIFDIEGEEGFRERESELIAELSQRRGCLIATGGGLILREENRRVMKRSGVVVWLQTSVSQQLKRLRQDKKRPLLQTRDREARLAAIAAKRDPIYEELADIVFPSQNRSIPLAAKRLSKVILSYWESPVAK
jgi:shikimate kinase